MYLLVTAAILWLAWQLKPSEVYRQKHEGDSSTTKEKK